MSATPVIVAKNLFRDETVPRALTQHANGRPTKTDKVIECGEHSTVLMNDSRARNTLNAVPYRDKMILQKPERQREVDSIHSNSADLSSSSSLSSSSPSKSLANTSTTAVSEFHVYQPQYQKSVIGSVRIRGGTSPSTEEDAGNRRDTLSRRSTVTVHGKKDPRQVDPSDKVTTKYYWDRNGRRCIEDERDVPRGPDGGKRNLLRGPTLSVEPEIFSPPVNFTQTPQHSLSVNSQRSFNAMRESDNNPPSSWLHAIRSIRESVDGVGGIRGSYVAPVTDSTNLRDRSATAAYTATAEMSSSVSSLRGVFDVSGQTESSSSSRTSHGTISRSDASGYHTNSHSPLTHPSEYQHLRKSHHTQVTHASTASFRHSHTKGGDLHAHANDSLSKSVSVQNVIMNGLNWFGDVSTTPRTRSTTDRFSIVLPSNEILTLDANGRAMFCGVIKDKNGRSLPCRLISHISSHNKVTLGKLDEVMLQEYRSLWASGKDHEDEDDSDTDHDTESGSDYDDIYEKHDKLLNSTSSAVNGRVESVSVQQSESTGKELKSPYSEFDSFYNCDSGDEKEAVCVKAVPLRDLDPSPPKRQPTTASKQKKQQKVNKRATKSDTLLRNVESSRLFSDELLLRSYSVTPHALGAIAGSSLYGSISHDSRSSISSSAILGRSMSGDSRTGTQTLPPLPSALMALYSRGAEIFENIRRTAPRVIMYVPATVQPSSSDPVQGT